MSHARARAAAFVLTHPTKPIRISSAYEADMSRATESTRQPRPVSGPLPPDRVLAGLRAGMADAHVAYHLEPNPLGSQRSAGRSVRSTTGV